LTDAEYLAKRMKRTIAEVDEDKDENGDDVPAFEQDDEKGQDEAVSSETSLILSSCKSSRFWESCAKLRGPTGKRGGGGRNTRFDDSIDSRNRSTLLTEPRLLCYSTRPRIAVFGLRSNRTGNVFHSFSPPSFSRSPVLVGFPFEPTESSN
jgi:hypothetical protein